MHRLELDKLILADEVLKLMLVLEKRDVDQEELQYMLNIAALNGRLNIVQILISKGANILYKQDVIIHNAVTSQNHELVEFLLEQGCDIDCMDRNYWTPLHNACFWGYETIARLLVVRGAKKTARDDNGVMPYMIAKNNVIRDLAYP